MIETNDLLERRVEKVLPSRESLQNVLQSKRIRLYQGFDPTGSRLHLGHTIGLRKLMDFANAGHEVIMLFGTGTVLVGDPSQRSSARKLITQEEIEENIKDWKRQVAPIVDFEKVSIRQNGDWLTQLSLKEIITIASNISAVQLFKREMFQRRLTQGDTVWYHETMYPLLQGYDSVVMDVDLEVGGSDQEFNMLIGRELQHKMNNREKFVLTTPMIMGTDGKPMSKTSGNCIWLADKPDDMYGKLMSLPDSQIIPYFELLTDIPLSEIHSLPNDPLANKKRLAFDITRQFHGTGDAQNAQTHFESTIQNKNTPVDIEEFTVEQRPYSVLELLEHANLGVSNSELKRLIRSGAVAWNDQLVGDPNETYTPSGGEILRFGKRTYRKARIG